MKKFKTLLVLTFALISCLVLTSCGIRPYNKPHYEIIEPQQTAFLIPLTGDSESQGSFESEQMLAEARVATKEVQIPRRWVQTGRWNNIGEYRDTAKLIVVDRTPVTREWSSTKDSGTSAMNQAIYAESKESIGFSAGMNCSAQIYTEADAVKFLFSYNGKTLEEIMDTEIRARVESDFVEACAKRTLNEVLEQKEEIMKTVRADVDEYFKNSGITITVLGMKDGLEYDDPSIQKAINEKFSSEQKLVVQKNENEVTISKAKAKAEAAAIEAEGKAKANKVLSDSLSDKLIEAQKIEKWNGSYATIVGSDSLIVDASKVDTNTAKTDSKSKK